MASLHDPPASQKVIKAEPELKFTDIFKWAILTNQLMGFFPFSCPNGKLRFHWISIPVVVTLIQIVVFSGWPCYSWATSKEVLKSIGVITPTEVFSYALFTTVSCLVGICLKLDALINRKGMLLFWDDIQHLFTHLCAMDCNKVFVQQVETVQSQTRTRISLFTLFSLLFIIPSSLLSISKNGNGLSVSDANIWNLILELLVNTFGSWILMNSTLIISFVTFFHLCLDFLRGELEKETKAPIQGSDKWKLLFPCKIARDQQSSGLKYSYNLSRIAEIVDTLMYLESHIEDFNKIWAAKMILGAFQAFSFLLFNGFFICIWVGRGAYEMLPVVAFPLVLNLVVLYRITNEGENLTAKAQQFIPIFNMIQLSTSESDTTLKRMGKHHTLQLLQNPPVLSPGKYFVINHRLMLSIFGSIMTYLMVLLQFQGNGGQQGQENKTN